MQGVGKEGWQLKLKLWIEGEKIRVECHAEITKDSFSFALAKSLVLTKALNNRREVSAQEEDCDLLYRPSMKRYRFTQLQQGELVICYEGGLEGLWATEHTPQGPYSCLREDVFAFSLLNGWYPVEDDADLCEVEVQVGAEWQIIHGQYDAENNVWHYRQINPVDCNIIGVRKEGYHVIGDEQVSLFFPDEQMRRKVQPYYHGYRQIADFYRTLYGTDRMGRMTMFFLPDTGEDFGGYKRDGLIVFTAVKQDVASALHHIAHELAHSYAQGADCFSWEDWLNETHAEWSALLYELEQDETFFERCLAKTKETYGDRALCLKDNGEGHSEFVHEAGVLVYEKVYRRYGANSIRTMLTTFDRLQEKNTKNFLQALRQQGKTELAEMVESYCQGSKESPK